MAAGGAGAARGTGAARRRADLWYTTALTTKLLREELQKLGWTEGRNLQLDFRFGNGNDAQTHHFAADLVQLAPDVIVTASFVALRALQQQTKTIPIVTAGSGDLVETGTVINSARPEGNVTGFANAFGSLGSKWLELLKEVAPNVARVAYMYPVGKSPRRHARIPALSLGTFPDSTFRTSFG
jgi:putative tryptophan/tyrosine transport system substrate-binding protein